MVRIEKIGEDVRELQPLFLFQWRSPFLIDSIQYRLGTDAIWRTFDRVNRDVLYPTTYSVDTLFLQNIANPTPTTCGPPFGDAENCNIQVN